MIVMPLAGCCDLCFDGEYFPTPLGVGGQGDCFGLVSGFPGRIEFYFDGACCARSNRFTRKLRNRATARTYGVGDVELGGAGIFEYKIVLHLLSLGDGPKIILLFSEGHDGQNAVGCGFVFVFARKHCQSDYK